MTTRRTPAQVKQDKACAAATAVAVGKAATAVQAKQRSEIADLEDRVRKDEQERQKHANRPDLQLSKGIKGQKASSVEDCISQASSTNFTPSVPAKPKWVLPPGWGIEHKTTTVQDAFGATEEPLAVSESDIAQDDLEDNEYEFKGMVDLPDDSVVDTESSMSDGLGLGDKEYDNKDGDYVMDTNSKSDDEEFEIEPAEVQHSRTKKASAKSLRGSFRHAVNAQRSAPPVTASGKLNTAQKRKLDGANTLTQSDNASVEKRPKRSCNVANAAASAAEPDDDDRDPQEYAGGVFDEDEPTTVVQAAAAKKVVVRIHNKSSGSQMTSVKITESAPVELDRSASGRHTRKIRFTTASLPFPRSNAVAYLQMWRKTFKPSIVKFGGNDPDPFGTNVGVEQSALLLWDKVYPNFTREVDTGTTGRAINRCLC
ncbi:hypothetical protein BYT27DRAFT_7209526 [Phlegmacium glaucopus]|nr:hypothetical protein BYT27DRAFT_7209526 [Phlegmacium glaucopus]